jgi:hypothetical protein
LQHVLSSQHLLAEVTHHGAHGVNNGHNLLVGNGGIDSTSTRAGDGAQFAAAGA